MTDELAVRLAAFDWLSEQVETRGEVLPWGVLQTGFTYRGERVPLLSQQGIFKPRLLIELYPDAARVLPELGVRLRIGLVSNGNSFADRCGIGFPLDFEVYSERAGCAKPDAAIFRLAYQAAGCRIGELVHVGDSLAEDVLAARAAGCAAVWLRRGRRVGEAPEGVPVIGSLDELPRLLG